jgi:hypothetical protein
LAGHQIFVVGYGSHLLVLLGNIGHTSKRSLLWNKFHFRRLHWRR